MTFCNPVRPHPVRSVPPAPHQRGATFIVLAGAALLIALLLFPIAAAAEQRATLEIVADRTAYEPGATVQLAAQVTIDDHWHVNSNTPTYDYLIPTVLSLELPDGASEPRMQYPPQKMMQFEFTDEPIAVYDGTFSIFAKVDLPADAAGTIEGAATLRYQACDDKQCEQPTTVQAPFQLTLGSGGKAANAGVFAQAAGAPAAGAPTDDGTAALAEAVKGQRASLQVAADRSAYEAGSTAKLAARVQVDDHWHVNSNTPTEDYLIPTELSFELPGIPLEPWFEYPADKPFKLDGFEEPIAVYDGAFTIFADIDLPADLPAGAIEGEAALLYQACDDKQCEPPETLRYPVRLTIGSGGQVANVAWFDPATANAWAGPPADGAPQTAAAPSGAEPAQAGLLWMLVLAVIGGLILNAMPCVLPVLSLKVFSLVKSAGEGRSQLVMGTLATTAGILVSFWALALAAVLAAKAGTLVGWGIQFQQPGFVAFLAVIVVIFALNMWGMFEILLPQSVAQVAGSSPREGLAGHFASGLFATLMATPCSAPFLGTAVGFALLQPTAVIFAIFTAIGLGLALPYLMLAAFPKTANLLPKPGAWMATFKHVMGFLLAGAAIWLFFILAAQIDSATLAFIQGTLLVLALCAWFFKHYQGQPGRRRLAAVGMAAAAVWCIVLAVGAPPAATADVGASELIEWVAFDEAEAERLAGEGNLVFVDFTAAWCLTCKSIEKAVIETSEVAAAFEGHGVVPMKADWTNRDDAITQVLTR
ncbi:MAG: protein-disulfide reductase DsbD domain-containing protein, partial [Acidobacteriota bacterium]